MAVTVQNPEEAVRSRGLTDPSRRNAVGAGVLFIVATAASLVRKSKARGRRQLPAERSGAGKGLWSGLGGGVEGDLVAEGFQVVNVVADGPLRAAAGVVEAGAEVDEVGLGVGQ